MKKFINDTNTEWFVILEIMGKIFKFENNCFLKDLLDAKLSIDVSSPTLDEQTGDFVSRVFKCTRGYDPECLGEYAVTVNIRNPYQIKVKSNLEFHIPKNKLNEIYWEAMYSFFGEEYKTALLNYLDSNKEQLDDYDSELSFAQKLGETINPNF